MEVCDEHGRYGLRCGAEVFPLQVVISVIYPCNFGCPHCPYTDRNSSIRRFYRERGGDLLPVALWRKIADECGPHGAWMRCTGGGEPMLHPHMPEMIEYAKDRGARIWLNTNGSRFGPDASGRAKLERIVRARTDLIEFSMDAADPETYALVRPLRGGPSGDPRRRFANHTDNVRAALALRQQEHLPTRVVVSLVCQQALEGKLAAAIRFWRREVGVDEVITRKFLSWDEQTNLDLGKALDKHLYADLPPQPSTPCVWPFERLNIDTLGRVALCGQDVSFRTAELFPTVWDQSIQAIWQGETFSWYRQMHLEGRGAECSPCRGCSAWRAGVRDWEHGWLKVLHRSSVPRRDAPLGDLDGGPELASLSLRTRTADGEEAAP